MLMPYILGPGGPVTSDPTFLGRLCPARHFHSWKCVVQAGQALGQRSGRRHRQRAALPASKAACRRRSRRRPRQRSLPAMQGQHQRGAGCRAMLASSVRAIACTRWSLRHRSTDGSLPMLDLSNFQPKTKD